MTLKEFVEKSGFTPVNVSTDAEEIEVTKVFCCDLLSIAMSKNPAGAVWVTVMGNLNAVAVSVLTEGACIVIAEGIDIDDVALEKAKQQNVTMLKSPLPIFDAGLHAHNIING